MSHPHFPRTVPMKRQRIEEVQGARAPSSDWALNRAALASMEVEIGELRARLATVEAAASQLRAANEAIARERAAEAAPFPDLGAVLPAGILLHIMDRAPSSKCVLFCFWGEGFHSFSRALS